MNGIKLMSKKNLSESTQSELNYFSHLFNYILKVNDKSENTELDSTEFDYTEFKKDISYYIDYIEFVNENNNKSEPNIEKQSSKLGAERFSIHSQKSFSSASSPMAQPTNNINTEERFRLLASINDSYFESGVLNEADKCFEKLVHKYGSITQPLVLLSDITNHSIDNEHVLEGVLHILSNYDYSEINPIGISIVLAAVVNHSPVVQDLLIGCFERWGSLDGIEILNKLVLDTPWLIQYRDEVVNQLQQVNGV